jgi:hypothetical protein
VQTVGRNIKLIARASRDSRAATGAEALDDGGHELADEVVAVQQFGPEVVHHVEKQPLLPPSARPVSPRPRPQAACVCACALVRAQHAYASVPARCMCVCVRARVCTCSCSIDRVPGSTEGHRGADLDV